MDIILNKIFSTSRRQSTTNSNLNTIPLDNSSFSCDGTIRILFFKECDRRGRKLLYDSKTISRRHHDSPQTSGQRPIQKSNRRSSTSSFESSDDKSQMISEEFVEIRNGFGYKCSPESPDSKDIGELVFGAVALAYKGHSSKFHKLTDPSRLLFSCTFPGPRSFRTQRSREISLEDSMSSLSASISEHIPKTETGYSSLGKTSHKTFGCLDSSPGLSVCYSEEDSGLSAPSSPFSTYGSLLTPSLPGTPLGTPSSRSGSGGSLNNSGSLNSLQKRFLRNVTTSLESLALISSDRSYEETSHRAHYQVKLGLAAIIEYGDESSEKIRTEQWWLEHSNLVETALTKLKLNLIEAYLHKNSFVFLSYQATERFQLELFDLLKGPRMSNPLWLSLSSCEEPDEKAQLLGKLSKSLEYLLTRCDTKQSNFFISRLLTAVLTNHLGWVTTISPNENSIVHGSTPNRLETKPSAIDSFLELPIYNAIWAQLSELTGAIGYPTKMSRTVAIGKNKKVLDHLLVVLSYIIRCSQIVKRTYKTTETTQDSSSTLTSPVSLQSLACPVTDDLHLDPDFCGSSSSQHSSSNIFELSQALTSSIDLEDPQESKWMLNEEETNIKSNKSCSDLTANTGNLYPTFDECESSSYKSTNNNNIKESDLKLKIYLETPESEIVPMQPPEDIPLIRERKLGRANLSVSDHHDVPIFKRTSSLQKGFTLVPQLTPEITETGRHEVAESYFGDVLDHYSSVFVLHGTTQTKNWEKEARQDLLASKHGSILDANPSELVTIVANCDTWDVELFSVNGDKTSKDCSTFPVMMSPLVSQITDSLVSLVSVLPPSDLAEAFESLLRDVYLKSHILSSYLLERAQQVFNQSSGFRSHSLFNLSDISDKLSIDINDLPLLLAVASTHTPDVTKMFGLTYR